MNKVLYVNTKKQAIWLSTHLVLFGGSLFMLFYAPFSGANDELMFSSFFNVVIGVGAVYCAVGIYVNMERIVKKTPALVIDTDGLTINTSVDSPKLRLEWKDVKFITKTTESPSIVLEIPSYTELHGKLSFISKIATSFGNLLKTDCILKKEYYKGSNSGVVIRFSLLYEKLDELYPIVEQAFIDYKNGQKAETK